MIWQRHDARHSFRVRPDKNSFCYEVLSAMSGTPSRVLNFDRMCRLCLHEKRVLIDIFEATEENCNLSISQKIKACATVNLREGDGLPTKICVPCLSSLTAAFDFRIQCENADKTLHSICHLLVSDEAGAVSNKKPPRMVNYVEEVEEEHKKPIPKQWELIDLNHVILIKRQDKHLIQELDGNCVIDVEKEEKDTQHFLNNLLKKDKELSDNIINDDLISLNVDGISTSDSLDVLSLHSKEFKELKGLSQVSFPAEKGCSGETSRLTPQQKECINLGSTEVKKKRKVSGHAKKAACPFCHKMLTRVNEHIRLLHRNKVYICKKQNCGAEFLTLKNLQSHQLKCYNMEKQYRCLRCFKEFHRKCNYKAHIIRHSNKKDFQCQLCDKAFVDSTGLKRHFLKHHEPQQETFISVCCDKRFKTKEGLKQHVQKGICGLQIFQVLQSNTEIM